MDDYIRRREQLISADRASRVDRNAFVELGSLMDDADSIVQAVRSSEALSVWGPESDTIRSADDATHIFPGMGFLTGACAVRRTVPWPRPQEVTIYHSSRHHPRDQFVQDHIQGSGDPAPPLWCLC